VDRSSCFKIEGIWGATILAKTLEDGHIVITLSVATPSSDLRTTANAVPLTWTRKGFKGKKVADIRLTFGTRNLERG
jgi:hypothetical protein